MLLTPKEMELLCMFHAGSLSKTLDVLRDIAKDQKEMTDTIAKITSITDKLDGLQKGETISLAFEAEK